MRNSHPAVAELSKVLRDIQIHQDRPDAIRFRNQNAVYMKLCNFERFDPNYRGKGLQAGGALEEKVWREFANDLPRLEETAAAIRARVRRSPSPEIELMQVEDQEQEDEFSEGRILYKAHRSRERNRTLVEKAKKLWMKRVGSLACHACGFDFHKVYGEIGAGFIECHHIVPISQVQPNVRTRVSDLALLCSNCHRMVHRVRPWLSLEGLRDLALKRNPVA